MTTDVTTRIAARVAGFLERDHGLLIDGAWVERASKEYVDEVDPSTTKNMARAAAGAAADVDLAIAAARRSFDEGVWSGLGGDAARQGALERGHADRGAADELAYLEAVDNGMPSAQARPCTSRTPPTASGTTQDWRTRSTATRARSSGVATRFSDTRSGRRSGSPA
jgi:phenylacetaldehyde dehydrogenase